MVESEVVENAAAQSPLEVLKAFVHETEDERQVTMKVRSDLEIDHKIYGRAEP